MEIRTAHCISLPLPKLTLSQLPPIDTIDSRKRGKPLRQKD